MGAVVGLVEDQAEVVYTLRTAALGLVGNWGTVQEHLEKALQDKKHKTSQRTARRQSLTADTSQLLHGTAY